MRKSRMEEESFDDDKKPIIKEVLRDEIKNKRNELSGEEVEIKSRLVKEKLFALPEFQSARIVAFYVALGKNNEVETKEMIGESLKLGKTVLVPVTDLIKDEIVFSEIKNFDDLTVGEFGILEPVPEVRKIYPYDAIRLAVVPGIVFDLHGHRIGYGLGFYDKFLSKLSRYVTKIGLAFELQVVERLPKEDHDVKLDKIITEDRIIECE